MRRKRIVIFLVVSVLLGSLLGSPQSYAEGKEPENLQGEVVEEKTEGKTEATEGNTETTEGKTEETQGKTESTEGKTESTEGKTESTEGVTEDTEGKTEGQTDIAGQTGEENPRQPETDQTGEAADSTRSGGRASSALDGWVCETSTPDMLAIEENGNEGIIRIVQGGQVTIRHEFANGHNRRIKVETTAPVDLTIQNLGFNACADSPIAVAPGGSLRLNLEGSNSIDSGMTETFAMIKVPPTAALTIEGSGTLTTRWISEAAVIGSGVNEDCGSITINSGSLVMETDQGACIGTGKDGKNFEEIVINGGTIQATAGFGAAIGSGYNYSNADSTAQKGRITINGGRITAESTSAAAIGGGQEAGLESITITGGTIDAIGGGMFPIGPGARTPDAIPGGVCIAGGSVNQSGGRKNFPDIKDQSGQPVYVMELTGQPAAAEIKVDETEYRNAGAHTTGSYYLYMTGKDHLISVTDTATGKTLYHRAVWDGTAETFSIQANAGDLIVVGDPSGWELDSTLNYLRIKKTGTYDIYNATNLPSKTLIYINNQYNSGIDVTLKIHDLSLEEKGINVSGAKVNLTLDGMNSITVAGQNSSCIEVGSGDALTISGTGSLKCNSKLGVGIGASGYFGDITINSGNIDIKSEANVGIGGSRTGKITITGGTVTAHGSAYGIGASDDIAEIYISGGSVKASGTKAISSIPRNNETANEEVAPFVLKDQSPQADIVIDGVSYQHSGHHEGDTSYYLYMTKKAHALTSDSKPYEIVWRESENVFKIKPPSPEIGYTRTANSITLTDTSGRTECGPLLYSNDNINWGTTNVFENLKADTYYRLYMKYDETAEYAASSPNGRYIFTLPATYSITIPSKATAGGQLQVIKVNRDSTFDIGYGGSILVKATPGPGFSDAGVLTLARTGGGNSLTSQFQVRRVDFTDLTKPVAEFKTQRDQAMQISFTEPTTPSGTIPAGNYSGTVVFTVSYQQ